MVKLPTVAVRFSVGRAKLMRVLTTAVATIFMLLPKDNVVIEETD